MCFIQVVSCSWQIYFIFRDTEEITTLLKEMKEFMPCESNGNVAPSKYNSTYNIRKNIIWNFRRKAFIL